MKSHATFRVRVFIFCAFLWLTNWSIVSTYERELGTTRTAIDLIGLGTLISAWIIFTCLLRIWKLFRVYLDKPFRVPRTLSLWGDWRYLLLLIPLALDYKTRSHGIADDGASFTKVFEYGGGSSDYTILFTGIWIMLLQCLSKLETLSPKNEE